MSKVIKLKKAYTLIKNYHKNKKSVVLVGGCFDIVHIGHIHFLKKAKALGDKLVVILESDQRVKMLKGENRPFHAQNDRAEILSSLFFVDLIVLLPRFDHDKDYDRLISAFKPQVIAAAKNDPLLDKKAKQIQSVSGVVKIIPYLETASTSKLARLLGID